MGDRTNTMAKKLTIDGKEIMARDDATIIQAAHEAGIALSLIHI